MPSVQFKVNDLVFVPCPEGKAEEGPFMSGVVCEAPEEGDLVVKVGKTQQRVPASNLRRRFIRDDGATCQDNTALVHLNDATILENLRARHEADEIYTYTASVLLAVNPYHDVTGLYGEAQCARYRGKHIGALPPHPYAIADTAYRALVRDRKNQGFIISGESGAGKTETAKIVMEYLGYVSGSTNQMTAQIQRRVLQAQPILESFGNAVTMRNNNSSRFGKYNSIFFDEDGTLCDASVTTYLLESSRVVVHAKRERTYHCFYEMLSGLPDEKLKKLHLDRAKLYLLLANEGQASATQEETAEEKRFHAQFKDLDIRNFNRLCVALRDVGFSEEDIDLTFQVLAGLVHLGDLSGAERDDDDESATIQLDEETLQKAGELLGIDPSELGSALRRRKVKVTRLGRESIHEVPRTTLQFRHALFSLIKALYKRLFERLVARINGSFSELRKPATGEDEVERCQIGILDIYGFERLQRNSFEQLCINLANERLQQYFVENVLTAEQNLYRREGLPWTGLTLPDSTPVVTAIACTFKTLDEYSQQLAKGFEKTSDEGFCQKTVEEAQKDPQRKEVLKPLKMSNKRGSSAGLAMNEGFIVKHYAGQVEYNTKGWLDKNNDRLLVECEELICGSECNFVRTLGDDEKSKVLFRSISKKYSADLENLLKTLNQCHLHYIRCFKPNELQKRSIFNDNLVLNQIVQCGTIELVKIMHDGYPNRCVFDELVARFRSLLPDSFQRYGNRTFIEALMLAYDVPKEDWALGMSRLFLKAGQLKALEDLRSKGAKPDTEKLQQIVRGIVRKRWVRAGHAVRLCNYFPRFLSAIRAAQAVRALATRALLVGRLQKLREAARRKMALRRRFQVLVRVAVLTKRFVDKLSTKVRRQRAWKRLSTTVGTWLLLQQRVLPWLARSRRSIQQKIEDERRENERRAAEEMQRIVEEKRRAEEERRKEEEEFQRKVEEDRRKLEEEKREAEERLAAEKAAALAEIENMRLQAQEEQRKEMERMREELERLKADQEFFKMEKEKQLRAEAPPPIMEVASPCRSSPNRRNSKTLPEDDSCSTALVTDDYDVGSSMSVVLQDRERAQMETRIKALEEDAAKRQKEVSTLVHMLMCKNRALDLRIEAEWDSSMPPDSEYPLIGLAPTTPRASDARRLSRGSSIYQADPRQQRRQSFANNDKRCWKEQREFLLEDIYPLGQPNTKSTPSKPRERRQSVGGSAEEAIQGERVRRKTQAESGGGFMKRALGGLGL